MKPTESWVWKAEEKQPVINLHKIKETFVHTSKEFCIPDLPSSKGKGLEIGSTNTKIHSDCKQVPVQCPSGQVICRNDDIPGTCLLS